MGDAAGVIVAVLAIYFLPAIVANSRGHHQSGAITVLNLFLGWTFLGWVGALVWSSTAVQPQVLPIVPQAEPQSLRDGPSRKGSNTDRIAAAFAGLVIVFVALGLAFSAISERSGSPTIRQTSTASVLQSQVTTASIPTTKAGKVTDLAIKEVRPSLSGPVLTIESAMLENAGAGTARDIRVTCETFGRSGSRISTVSKVLYEVLPPGKHIAIRRVNVGNVDAKSQHGQCDVTGAKFD